MKLLLDTHAFIWMAADPERLSARAVAAVRDAGNDVYLSAVSGWEVAIKRARGRLRFPPIDSEMVTAMRVTELPVALRHAAAVSRLPDHHRDPFDRMLIAQAVADDLVIVTSDRAFGAYDVITWW